MHTTSHAPKRRHAIRHQCQVHTPAEPSTPNRASNASTWAAARGQEHHKGQVTHSMSATTAPVVCHVRPNQDIQQKPSLLCVRIANYAHQSIDTICCEGPTHKGPQHPLRVHLPLHVSSYPCHWCSHPHPVHAFAPQIHVLTISLPIQMHASGAKRSEPTAIPTHHAATPIQHLLSLSKYQHSVPTSASDAVCTRLQLSHNNNSPRTALHWPHMHGPHAW